MSKNHRLFHTNASINHNDKQTSYLQLDGERQTKPQYNNRGLVYENDILRKEFDGPLRKNQNIDLAGLNISARNQPRTYPNNNTRVPLVQGQHSAYEEDRKLKDKNVLDLINHFSVVVQHFHDVLQDKNQETKNFKDVMDRKHQMLLEKEVPFMQTNVDIEDLRSNVGRIRESYRQVNSALAARNENLERNVNKYLHEIQNLRNQLEFNAAQNNASAKLLSKKEKENKRLKQVIRESQNKTRELFNYEGNINNITVGKMHTENIKTSAVDEMNNQLSMTEPYSNYVTSEVDNYGEISRVNNSNKKLKNLLDKLQVISNQISPKTSNDHQKHLDTYPGNEKYEYQTALENRPEGKQYVTRTNFQTNPTDYEIETTQLPARRWISLERPNKMTPSCQIMIMSYNILSDRLATPQKFTYCPSWALQWEYRKKLILSEIKMYSADIVCLQEVETHHFYNFFLPELKLYGYDGIFSPKSRANNMTIYKKKYVDGCAIFFKTFKFRFVEEYLVEFNQLFKAISVGSNSRPLLNRVMPRDNIGLMALLLTKEAAWDNGLPDNFSQPVLVSTTHILSKPDFCDVKVVQVMMWMYALRMTLDNLQPSMNLQSDVHHMPVQLLVCGDLNGVPGSGAIELLSTGRISYDHPDFNGLPYKNVLQNISDSRNSKELTHSFDLTSAYGRDALPFTNYTADFVGVLDYIFYLKEQMTLLKVLGPLDQRWLNENNVVGAPHPQIPSDHFPVVALLEMSSM